MSNDVVKRVKIVFESDVANSLADTAKVEKALGGLGKTVGDYTKVWSEDGKIIHSVIVETQHDLETLGKGVRKAFESTDAALAATVQTVKEVTSTITKQGEILAAETKKTNDKKIADDKRTAAETIATREKEASEILAIMKRTEAAKREEARKTAAAKKQLELSERKNEQDAYASFINLINAGSAALNGVLNGRLTAERTYANTSLGIEQKLADDVAAVQRKLQEKLKGYIQQEQFGQKSRAQAAILANTSTAGATTQITNLINGADQAKAALDALNKLKEVRAKEEALAQEHLSAMRKADAQAKDIQAGWNAYYLRLGNQHLAARKEQLAQEKGIQEGWNNYYTKLGNAHVSAMKADYQQQKDIVKGWNDYYNRLGSAHLADMKQQQAMEKTISEAWKENYARQIAALQQANQARSEAGARQLQLEHLAIQRNGGQKAILLQEQANLEIDIKRRTAAAIEAIQGRITAGTMNHANAVRASGHIFTNEEAQIRATRAALENKISALSQVEDHTRSMSARIIEAIGIYKLFNTALQLTKSALLSIPRTGIEMQSTISALHASFGTDPNTGAVNDKQGELLTGNAMKDIREEANRTGISIITLEKNYRSFLASAHLAGESTKTVNTIFRDLNTTITALHMSGDRAELTFLALSQMFNKGKIQSEELVKQLGNLLPGAFAAFAKANDMSTQQLITSMRKGTVQAHETVAKFIGFYAKTYAGAFEIASSGLNATLGRLETAWTNLSRTTFIAVQDVLAATVEFGTQTIENLTPTELKLQKLTKLWKEFTDGMSVPFKLGGAIWDSSIGAFLEAQARTPYRQEKALRQTDFGSLSLEGKTEFAAKSINLQLQLIEELEAKQASLAKGFDLFGIHFINSGDIKKTDENLAKAKEQLDSYISISKEVAYANDELNKANEKSGINVDQAVNGRLDALLKQTQTAQEKYQLVVDELNAMLDKQGGKFTDDSGAGLSLEKWNKIIAHQQSLLEKADNKASKKTIADTNAILTKEYGIRKEILQNANAVLEAELAKEEKLFASQNKDLDSQLKQGVVSLTDYYRKKETAMAANYSAEYAILAKRRKLEEENLNAEKQAASQAKDANPILGKTSFIAENTYANVNAELGKYAKFIKESADANGVSEAMVYAIMGQESGGKAGAVSSAGAKGLMQLLSGTYKEVMGSVDGIFDPKSNIEAGTRYFAKMLSSYKGQNEQFIKALAAYNAGPGNVAKAMKHGIDWKNFLPKETQDYIEKIPAKLAKLGIPQENIQSFDDLAEASKRVIDAQGKLNSTDAAMEALLEKNTEGVRELTNSWLERIAAISIKYETPEDKFARELKELDELRAGYNDLKLTEGDYFKAKNEAERIRDKAIEQLKEEANAHKELDSILKGLNRDTLKAGKDDRTLFLDTAQEQIIEGAKKSGQALIDLEDQMRQVGEAYDRMITAQQTAELIDSIKSGFADGFKSILDGTKTFGEAFKGILDNAIDTIINQSLNNLMTGFQNVFRGVSGGWTQVLGSMVQLGVAAAVSLFSKKDKKAAPSGAMSFQGTTPGLSAFKGSDLFSREAGEGYQTSVSADYNDTLNKLASMVYANSTSINSFISDLGSQLQNSVAGSYVAELFRPLTDGVNAVISPFTELSNVVTKATSSISTDLSSAFSSAFKVLGLTSNVGATTLTAFSNTTTLGMASAITPTFGTATALAPGATAAQAAITPAFSNVGAAAAGIDKLSQVSTTLATSSTKATAALGNVSVVLAIAAAGYGIVTAAMNENYNVGEKVAHSLYAVSDAMLSIGLMNAFNPVGWVLLIAAAVTNAIGSVTEMISGDFKQGLKRMLFGVFADMIPIMKPREPNTWFNNFNASAENIAGRQDLGEGIYSRPTNKGKFIGADTAMGSVELSYHEIPKKQSMADLDASFVELVRIYQKTNGIIADSLTVIDKVTDEGVSTVSMWIASLDSGRVAMKQKLSEMDSSQTANEYYSIMSERLQSFGTIAGQIWGTLFDNLSAALVNINPENSVYAAGTAQLASLLAPLMADLPVKVIDDLTRIIKAPAVGGDIQEIYTELLTNLTAYNKILAFASMSEFSIEAVLEPEKVSGMIAKWSELGLEITSASDSWIAFVSIFQKAAGDMKGSELLDAADSFYNELINKFKGTGYTESQSYTLANTAVLGAQQVQAMGAADSEMLSGGVAFAKAAAKLAKQSFDEANEAVDAAILKGKQEGILNAQMTREAMTSILVRTNALDAETMAQANFDIAVAKTTQTLNEGYNAIAGVVIGLRVSLTDLGLSVETLPDAVQRLTDSFGSMDEAVDRLRTTLTVFFGEAYVQQMDMETATKTQQQILDSRPDLVALGLTAGMDAGEIQTLLSKVTSENAMLLSDLSATAVKAWHEGTDADYNRFADAALQLETTASTKFMAETIPTTAGDPFQVGSIPAIEEAKKATEDLSKATEDAAALAKKHREMEIQLMAAQGFVYKAMLATRQEELAAMDGSLVILQKQIWAAEDANKTRDLEHSLMQLQGRESEVLVATRERELLALSNTDGAIQKAIWGLEDLNAVLITPKGNILSPYDSDLLKQSGVTTVKQWDELASGIDSSTEAGQWLLGVMKRIKPAFEEIANAAIVAIDLFSSPEQKQAALGAKLADTLGAIFAPSELAFMAEGGTDAVVEMYNYLLSTGEEGAAKIAALNAVAPDVKEFAAGVDSAANAIKTAIDLFLTPEQKITNLGNELYAKLLPAFGNDLLVRMAEGGSQAVVDVYNELGNMGEEGKRLQAILLANASAISEFSKGVGDISAAAHKAAIDLFSSPKQKQTALGNELHGELSKVLSQADIGVMIQGKDATIGLYNSFLNMGMAGKEEIAILDKLHPKIKEWLDYEEAIVKQRYSMETSLLETQGYTILALTKKREEELLAMDESLRPLQMQIYAEQDLSKTRSLEIELLNLADDEISALALTREMELRALSDTDRAIKSQIYNLQDLKTAVDKSKEATSIAMKVLQKAVDTERKAITDKYNAGIKSTQTSIDALTTSVDKLKKLSDALKNFMDNLVIKGQEAATRMQAQATLTSALIIAKAGGGIANPEELIKAVDIAARPSEDLFGSFVDYQSDFLTTANTIGELAGLTDSMLSVDDAQLKLLKDSLDIDKEWYDKEMLRLDRILEKAQEDIDAVNGVTVAVMSVSDAIMNLATAIAAQAAAQATYIAAQQSAGSVGGGGVARPAVPQAPISSPIYGGIDPYADYGTTIVPVTQTPTPAPASAPAAKPYVPSAAVSAALSSGQNFATTVRTFVNDTLANGNPIDIYQSAIEQGVQAGTLDGIMGWSAGTSNAWATANNLPTFAAGINEVPYDMTASIHKGERILPAADNEELMLRLSEPRQQPSNTGTSRELLTELKLLRQTVEKQGTILETQNQIISDQSEQLLEIQIASKSTANTLDNASGGRPLNVQMV